MWKANKVHKTFREPHVCGLIIKQKVGWQQVVRGASVGLPGHPDFGFYLETSGASSIQFKVGIDAPAINVKLNE